MPVTSSIADIQKPTQSPSTAKLTALKLAILQFLEPGVLPVLALALMVGGWSYGKKLSHYFHNTHVTKASTTRMWLDHRNDAVNAPVAIHQVEHKFLTPQLSIMTWYTRSLSTDSREICVTFSLKSRISSRILR